MFYYHNHFRFELVFLLLSRHNIKYGIIWFLTHFHCGIKLDWIKKSSDKTVRSNLFFVHNTTMKCFIEQLRTKNFKVNMSNQWTLVWYNLQIFGSSWDHHIRRVRNMHCKMLIFKSWKISKSIFWIDISSHLYSKITKSIFSPFYHHVQALRHKVFKLVIWIWIVTVLQGIWKDINVHIKLFWIFLMIIFNSSFLLICEGSQKYNNVWDSTRASSDSRSGQPLAPVPARVQAGLRTRGSQTAVRQGPSPVQHPQQGKLSYFTSSLHLISFDHLNLKIFVLVF